ncbi:cytochrome c biogenesis protein ResB [Oleiharenicola lentus]|uniref:cytochrome c biogenesis protein ResB n=1 Tax=Oleiharenicola lentus TaxID=2508720 RepID=UPI003F672CC9
MTPLSRQFRDFFVSLKLTVWLLALSIILIFWATLAQVQLGVWGVQQKFFHAFFVLERIPGTDIPVPVFPGGYFLGGLLLINLIAAHVYRFKLEWKKAGIQLTHSGLILLLIGELITGLMQQESQMRLDEGQTKNYSESYRLTELAIIDTTNPDFNEVVSIPEARLADGGLIQFHKLPFQIRIHDYFANAMLQMRDENTKSPPGIATAGLGPRVNLVPLRLTYKQDERNAPAANVEFIGTEGSFGIFVVSPLLGLPQKFDYQGKTYEIALRFQRFYKPFSISLLDFRHDKYAGTEIPKNFSSQIKLKDSSTKDDREVLIFMNNPLRHGGLTFYQAGYEGDQTTVLQVVRNPGWLLPYISCIMMGVGLLLQFSIHLIGFIRKRSAA